MENIVERSNLGSELGIGNIGLVLNPHSGDLGLGAVQPRKFNNIVYENGKVIKTAIGSTAKKSLDGERYWYETIPDGLEDLFPEYIPSLDSVVLEKVNGSTFTSLLLGNTLTVGYLNTLLESVERIHQSHDSNDLGSHEDSIYYNYKDKVRSRFFDYDYSRFRNSTTVFGQIISVVESYEDAGLGHRSIIHGDPVFSNVLLTSTSTLKFIDMRGEIGGRKTKFGDKFYDYAKIYQSLTGYDYILVEDRIESTPLKDVFEQYFVSNYGFEMMEYLKYLTASLYFSLIPLHDNDKCDQFYECIFDLIQA